QEDRISQQQRSLYYRVGVQSCWAADRSRAHNCITKGTRKPRLGPHITGATWELGRNPKTHRSRLAPEGTPRQRDPLHLLQQLGGELFIWSKGEYESTQQAMGNKCLMQASKKGCCFCN
uniref:Uncharacterized protein n=1 Tax=Oryza glaberrima TaxID=4538 RepID=I1QY43_ORYGL